MKTSLILTILLAAFLGKAQSTPHYLNISRQDVLTNTVRILTSQSNPVQNVRFYFAHKNSEEIKGMVRSQVYVRILRNNKLIATTDFPCGACEKGTNYMGLVLIFKDYATARNVKNELKGEF